MRWVTLFVLIAMTASGRGDTLKVDHVAVAKAWLTAAMAADTQALAKLTHRPLLVYERDGGSEDADPPPRKIWNSTALGKLGREWKAKPPIGVVYSWEAVRRGANGGKRVELLAKSPNGGTRDVWMTIDVATDGKVVDIVVFHLAPPLAPPPPPPPPTSAAP